MRPAVHAQGAMRVPARMPLCAPAHRGQSPGGACACLPLQPGPAHSHNLQGLHAGSLSTRCVCVHMPTRSASAPKASSKASRLSFLLDVPVLSVLTYANMPGLETMDELSNPNRWGACVWSCVCVRARDRLDKRVDKWASYAWAIDLGSMLRWALGCANVLGCLRHEPMPVNYGAFLRGWRKCCQAGLKACPAGCNQMRLRAATLCIASS